MTADGEAEHTLAGVQRLFPVCELSCLEHGKISVRAQLRVHAEIHEIAVCDELTEGVRHTAYTELHAGAVFYIRQQQICYFDIRLCRRGVRHLKKRRIAGLDYMIDLGNVNPCFLAALYARNVSVYLDDDDLGIAGYAF